jgi:hypothetical protein
VSPYALDLHYSQARYVGVLGGVTDLDVMFDCAWSDVGWRETVTDFYPEHAGDPGVGWNGVPMRPAICSPDWFR